MKVKFVYISFIVSLCTYGQEPVLSMGSRFPDMMIANISNAPIKEFYLNKVKDNKFYILNFWGTWCSPCIPEMDTLAKLQKQNAERIQVIAISDDDEERKSKYLKNKPSGIWLATDTGYTLYNMLSFISVGQSAIINPDKRIVALVQTDSINQQMINRLLRRDTVKMSAGIKESMIKANEDAFGVDSLTQHSFTIRGYKKGQQTMGKRYLSGIYKGRRISWFNVTIGLLYRTAYNIKSYKVQELYDSTVTEKDVSDFENKSTLYCVDLLMRPEQKDSLFYYLQQYLNAFLPVKARSEKRVMPVYVLKRKDAGALKITLSEANESSFGFSGKGYDGTKVLVKDFAEDYLDNELGLPVVDETGLPGYYDIKTNVEQRDEAGILKSIENIGFVVEKAERKMPVIVYYK
ncbi:redoxin domain-containing protein [Parafilimonas sp.]|uniref:redoxin domain-containing protein n=1 Tax=Parafilimonas sp. TaxID=1969739 RepID=UPI0039E5D6E9